MRWAPFLKPLNVYRRVNTTTGSGIVGERRKVHTALLLADDAEGVPHRLGCLVDRDLGRRVYTEVSAVYISMHVIQQRSGANIERRVSPDTLSHVSRVERSPCVQRVAHRAIHRQHRDPATEESGFLGLWVIRDLLA